MTVSGNSTRASGFDRYPEVRVRSCTSGPPTILSFLATIYPSPFSIPVAAASNVSISTSFPAFHTIVMAAFTAFQARATVNHPIKAASAIAVCLLIFSLYVDIGTIRKDRFLAVNRKVPVSLVTADDRNEFETTRFVLDVSTADAIAWNKNLLSSLHEISPSAIEMNEYSTPQTQQQQHDKVLCIDGPFWGQTFNRIIQTANALTLAKTEEAVAVGLNAKFSTWYETFLDPRKDIWLNYTGPCFKTVAPKDIFRYYNFDMKRVMQYLYVLVPKAIFRAEAEAAMKKYPSPTTTVHRRHLEGKCVGLASNYSKIVCPNGRAFRQEVGVAELVNMCNLEYGMIVKETVGTTVVLLTDGQVPELDETFPHISNHSFPVQTWMMTLSNVHYGNPFSTVDLIVSFWREALGKGDTTLPKTCWKAP